MVSFLRGFIFTDKASCNTGLYHAWWYGDRFFTFDCCTV